MRDQFEDNFMLTEEQYFQEMFFGLSTDLLNDEDFEANADFFADISDGFFDYNRISNGSLPPERGRKILEIIISSMHKNGVY